MRASMKSGKAAGATSTNKYHHGQGKATTDDTTDQLDTVPNEEEDQPYPTDHDHDSFRLEKLRIVNCLTNMDGSNMMRNSYSASQVLDAAAIMTTTRRKGRCIPLSNQEQADDGLAIAQPKGTRSICARGIGGGHGLPGAVRVDGCPRTGSFQPLANRAATATSLESSRDRSMKRRQIQAASQILKDRQGDVISVRSVFDEQTDASTCQSSKAMLRKSSTYLSSTDDEEESSALQEMSTTIEDVTLRDSEPSPIPRLTTVESGTNPKWWNKKFTRKTTVIFALSTTLLVTVIVAVLVVVMKFLKKEEDNGEYTTCADLKKIPNIWNQCQNVVAGGATGTIGAIPSCQEDMYETLRVALAEYLPDDGLTIDSCDNTNMALLTLAETSTIIDPAEGLPSSDNLAEKLALACLYFSAHGNEWFHTSEWLSESSHCTWHGITCDNSGFVEEIDLSRNNLQGTIPSELAILTDLKYMLISDGALEGTIPSEVYRSLSNLEILLLRHNRITEISAEIGNLESLTELSLEMNDLRENTLPSEVGLLSNLKVINLEKSELGGELPTELGKCVSMKKVILSTNPIRGTLPSEIGQLTDLLNLEFHGLGEGVLIPNTIFHLTQLTSLSLDGNVFENQALPVPLLTNLTNLRSLSVVDMSITGTLPSTELGFWEHTLEHLSLAMNRISGTIPTEIGILTRLRSLVVANNDLEGQLPSELGRLTGLSSIFLKPNFELDLINIPPEVEKLASENGLVISPADLSQYYDPIYNPFK